jgi:hypothetical protein
LVWISAAEINDSFLLSISKQVQVPRRFCSQSTVFLRKKEDEMLPSYLRNKEIFYSGNVTIFIMQIMTTAYFDSDFFAYFSS